MMADLLSRYAETELDQSENWRVATTHGDVFIEVRRTLDADPNSYDDLTAWLDRR